MKKGPIGFDLKGFAECWPSPDIQSDQRHLMPSPPL
jgi:hypothetical protein